MRVLWLSACAPARYTQGVKVIGGWQDSVESIVSREKSVKLAVVFPVSKDVESKIENGVYYCPMYTHLLWYEKLKVKTSAYVFIEKQLKKALEVIEEFNPNVIQVFGTEFGYGLIAKYTKIPVVVHIQGAMIPYDNANYPPGYNGYTYFKAVKGNPLRLLNHYILSKFRDSRVRMEKEVWRYVNHYMGRTEWDKAVSGVMHPDRTYFHVEEALRPVFLSGKYNWMPPKDGKIRLVSTGCSTLWKGPDMMLKTAKILKQIGVEFEWNVCGHMPNEHRMIVEYHEGISFRETEINILGMTPPDQLADLLCHSTIYVHTSYIDNSPNSICEAQCIGIPIISTNVGGISSLIHNGIDGILVPANDPYQMAFQIVTLCSDTKRLRELSESAKAKAMERHRSENILVQLKSCYSSIIKHSSQ